MAEKFVIRDTDESKARMIMEPRFLARLRRLKAIWNAAVFLARDDEPGFLVKWNGWTRKTAWEEAGFDVTHTPTESIVAPKGVNHV